MNKSMRNLLTISILSMLLTWTVTWKTADGQEISKKLDLTDKLPKGFKGHLIFTISAKNDLGYVTEKFSEE